jgi:hypothetical protein
MESKLPKYLSIPGKNCSIAHAVGGSIIGSEFSYRL